jgi:hypothetical protein
MQPQQPYTPPPIPAPGQPQPDYGFITNAGPPPKKLSLLPSGSSTMQRALIALGGLVILVIIIVIFVSILTGGKNINASLTSLAARQNELVRIATLGTQQASSQDAKNFAISAQLSLGSDQQQLISYIASQGHKVGTKELAADQDTKTDSQLNTAAAASTFDTTFSTIMQNELTSYTQELKTTFAKATKQNAKVLLNQEYQNAQLLLKQVPTNTGS